MLWFVQISEAQARSFAPSRMTDYEAGAYGQPNARLAGHRMVLGVDRVQQLNLSFA